MANRSPICKQSPQTAAAGFTYIGLLILLAIISIGATATVQLGAITQRRSAEDELLHIGRTFRAALASYQNSTPGGMPRLPKEMTDLTKDPRQPVLRRHLRHIPVDPITGKAEWGVVRTPDGFVEAIHSLSEARPIKIANFEPDFAAFEGSQKYSEWEFGRLSPKLKQP
jgi:type II secretory pathway pseudopilin PulG